VATKTVETRHSLPGFLRWLTSPDAPGGAALGNAIDTIQYFLPDPVSIAVSALTGKPHISQGLLNRGIETAAATWSFLTGSPVTYTQPFSNSWEADPVYLRRQIALGREPKYLAWVLANWNDIEAGKFAGSLNPEQQATVEAVREIMRRGEDIPVYGMTFAKGTTSPTMAQVTDAEAYQRYQVASRGEWPGNVQYANREDQYAALRSGNERSTLYEDAAVRRDASQFTLALRDLAGHEALRRAEQEIGKNPTEIAELYWNGAYRFAAEAWGLSDAQKEWLRQQLHAAARQWVESGATVPFQDYLRQRALEHQRALVVSAQAIPPAPPPGVPRDVTDY